MLSQKIKELRIKRGLSQNDLSKVMNVSQQTIGSWEVGRTEPDSRQILELAQFFSVPTDYLFGQVVGSEVKKNAPSVSADEAIKIMVETKLGRPANDAELALVEATADALIEQLRKQQ